MRKKHKIGICLLLILSMMALSLTGCSSKEKKNVKSVVLNEVAHSIFYAPLYVAIEKGYFEEEGIDLTLVTGFGADKTMTSLLSGEADIGFMGPETTIYTYQGGMKDYAVNFAQLTQRAGNFLVSREKEPAFTWESIKGKTVIAGRSGGMPQMIFEYVLKKNGLDPKKDLVMDQSIDFGSTAAAFSGGHGDYTVEFEPHATALELKGDGYVVCSLGEESGFVPYTAFSAKQSYIAENPEVITAFLKAVQRGIDYVHSHTAEEIATEIKGQFKETEMESLVKIVDRYAKQGSFKENMVFDEEAFHLLLDILRDAGQVNETVPYEKLVNTVFAKDVIGK